MTLVVAHLSHVPRSDAGRATFSGIVDGSVEEVVAARVVEVVLVVDGGGVVDDTVAGSVADVEVAAMSPEEVTGPALQPPSRTSTSHMEHANAPCRISHRIGRWRFRPAVTHDRRPVRWRSILYLGQIDLCRPLECCRLSIVWSVSPCHGARERPASTWCRYTPTQRIRQEEVAAISGSTRRTGGTQQGGESTGFQRLLRLRAVS